MNMMMECNLRVKDYFLSCSPDEPQAKSGDGAYERVLDFASLIQATTLTSLPHHEGERRRPAYF